MKRVVGIAVGAAMLAACIETPQHRIQYPAVAVPSGERTLAAGDWTINVSRAELAFGPAYFCASASGSSTLCATAVAELTSVARIDALAGGPIPLGRIDGVTGPIRSVSYDLGILWLDTQPQATAAAEAPSGHSAVIEGEASKGEAKLPFIVVLDVAPQYQGQHAIATSPAVGDVESDSYQLEVRVDPVRWLAQIDFDTAAARPERPLVFGVGSPEHSAVIVGLKSLAPPEFRWVPIQR
jgi:hypothetical protein